MERVVCRWRSCGVILCPKPNSRIVVCGNCRHVTCLSCDAAHEGTNCETFRTQSMILHTDSPVRGSSNVRAYEEVQAPSFRTPSAGGSPGRTASQTSPRKGTRSPVFPAKPNSPVKPPVVRTSPGAASSQSVGKRATSTGSQKIVHCASEDCGYEVEVDADETELPCYKCRNTTCLLCNAIHRDLTCEDYQKKLKPPTMVREEEIQVRCAGVRCHFIAYVGASMPQMSCPECKRITCIKCRAVHEFETCEEYKDNCRRSSAGQVHLRTVTVSTVAEETEKLKISDSPATSRLSRGFDSARTDGGSPAFITSSEASITRDAPRQNAVLVQHSADQAQPANETIMVECCHCLVESPFEEIIEVLSCGHFLCTECVHGAAVNSLTYLVLCPLAPQGSVRCQFHIQESALKKVMSPAEYERRKELLTLPILHCPVEGCSGKFCARRGVQRIECPSCGNEYCVPCSASHPGSSCEQFIQVVAGTAVAARLPYESDSDDSDDDGEDVVGLKPPATVREEEIQVRCAGARCNFIAYVGVSEPQMNCPHCERITCIQCRAVHNFETCEEYADNCRHSSAGQAHLRTVTVSAVAEETEKLKISDSPAKSRPSRGFDSARTEGGSPAFITSSEASITRDAPRQNIILVQHSADQGGSAVDDSD